MPKYTKPVIASLDALPEASQDPSLDTPSTFTDWQAFAKAGLVPVGVACQAYAPTHRNDTSCHSYLRYTAETLRRHTEGGHGGAFQFYLKRTDSTKPSKLWKELAESGLEAYDLRCDICDATLRFHPSSILPHCKPHRGKLSKNQDYPIMKSAQSKAEGKFNVTVQLPRVIEVVEEDEEEY